MESKVVRRLSMRGITIISEPIAWISFKVWFLLPMDHMPGFLKNFFLRIFFLLINMGPYGSKSFKILLLPQITFESFPEISSQCSSQKYRCVVWNFEFPIIQDFFSLIWGPMRAKVSKRYSSLKSLLYLFLNFSWGFFSVILTKVLLWILEILSLRFFTIFFLFP